MTRSLGDLGGISLHALKNAAKHLRDEMVFGKNFKPHTLEGAEGGGGLAESR